DDAIVDQVQLQAGRERAPLSARLRQGARWCMAQAIREERARQVAAGAITEGKGAVGKRCRCVEEAAHGIDVITDIDAALHCRCAGNQFGTEIVSWWYGLQVGRGIGTREKSGCARFLQ